MNKFSKCCSVLMAIVLSGCAAKTPSPAAESSEQSPAAVQSVGGSSAGNCDSVTVEYLTGRFDPAKDARFVRIRSEHGNGEIMYMRREAYEAFGKMFEAAKKEGVALKIVSATRPFDRQRLIWEEKWNGKRAVDGEFFKGPAKDSVERAKKIMRWSSMPGTSRHHWGTDIDLNQVNNAYFAQGPGKKMYDWLVANAGSYGFCQVYSEMGNSRPHGYQEEKWHWSYLPIAAHLTECYRELIGNADIKGFIGAETAPKIQAVEHYVLGINPECKKK